MKDKWKAILQNKRNQWIGVAILLSPFLFILFLKCAVSWEWIGELPTKEEIASIDNPIASNIYASNGEVIGRYYYQNRAPLELEDLNEAYKNALISTEDHRFFEHGGVDYKSLFRVIFKTILLQDDKGGGSTITQQLAKNLYPRKSYSICSTLINKFREMSIAGRIEDTYTKDQILLLYSNTVSFGEQAFGLQTASNRFFNKQAKELSVVEAATLVGLLKATTYYSPRFHPERSKLRRNVVLNQMYKRGFLSAEDHHSFTNTPLELDYQDAGEEEGFSRYFKRQVQNEFNRWAKENPKEDGGEYVIHRDGLRIYTSLDFDLQKHSEKVMKMHMSKLQKLFLSSWKNGRMFGPGTKLIDEYILKDPYYIDLKEKGLSSKEILDKFTETKSRQFWEWNDDEAKRKTKIDSIKHYLSLLHTGILAADPKTGEIKTWIGGIDYGKFQYDNVMSPRQVGSLFKPIAYLSAIQQGAEPCKYYENEKKTYSDYQDWSPGNADEEYGGYMSLKHALTHSVNTVSVQVLFEAGVEEVVKLARILGIESPLNPVPSIVLGTSDVSLYEMIKAYCSFANYGNTPELYSILKIEDKNGQVLYDRSLEQIEAEQSSVLDSNHVNVINAILQQVTIEGTGARLNANYRIPYPVKGKTGTTQNQSDGWFIGYTEDLVVGAWVGTEDRRIHFRNLGTGSGGRTALPMVGEIFQYAASKGILKDQSYYEFEEDCQGQLTEEEYSEYMQQQQRSKIELFFEEKLRELFERKDDGGISIKPSRKDIRKIKKERRKSIKNFEKQLKELDKQRNQ